LSNEFLILVKNYAWSIMLFWEYMTDIGFSVDLQQLLIVQISDSQTGFRGTLGYREHFLGVPRDVEITNVL